jgi:hypothetical protein
MADFAYVRSRLENLKHSVEPVRVPSAEIHLDPEGLLVLGGRHLEMTKEARDKIVDLGGIPPSFYDKCPADLGAHVFNRLFSQKVSSGVVAQSFDIMILNNNTIAAICEPRLSALPAIDVLDIVLSAAPGNLTKNENALQVHHFRLNGSMSVSLLSPDAKAEPRPRDIVQAGVDIYHSTWGDFATQVNTYLLRLVCSNGALIRVCEHEHGVRIRRDEFVDRNEMLGRVRRVAELAWSDLDKKLDVLKRLATEPAEDINAVIEKIARDSNLSLGRAQTAAIVQAMNEDEFGNDGTILDVWNAFTRLATHATDRPLQWRRRLMFASGGLLKRRYEKCKVCNSVYREPRS